MSEEQRLFVTGWEVMFWFEEENKLLSRLDSPMQKKPKLDRQKDALGFFCLDHRLEQGILRWCHLEWV